MIDANATLIGQITLAWVLIATILTYMLAKRKTETPILATIIGFIAAFIPPISIIYIIILVLKNDVAKNDSSS